MTNKTFTNPLVLKADTRIKADKILEGIEILRFQGFLPDSVKLGMMDRCPGCNESAWGLFTTEEVEAREPVGVCLQCNATIYVDENGEPNAHTVSSQDLLRGMGIGKGK